MAKKKPKTDQITLPSDDDLAAMLPDPKELAALIIADEELQDLFKGFDKGGDK